MALRVPYEVSSYLSMITPGDEGRERGTGGGKCVLVESRVTVFTVRPPVVRHKIRHFVYKSFSLRKIKFQKYLL